MESVPFRASIYLVNNLQMLIRGPTTVTLVTTCRDWPTSTRDLPPMWQRLLELEWTSSARLESRNISTLPHHMICCCRWRCTSVGTSTPSCGTERQRCRRGFTMTGQVWAGPSELWPSPISGASTPWWTMTGRPMVRPWSTSRSTWRGKMRSSGNAYTLEFMIGFIIQCFLNLHKKVLLILNLEYLE